METQVTKLQLQKVHTICTLGYYNIAVAIYTVFFNASIILMLIFINVHVISINFTDRGL